MPTYDFKKRNGQVVEEMMTIAEFERRFGGLGGKGKLKNGVQAVAVMTSSPMPPGGGKNKSSRYPYYSWSTGCHPDQRHEMMDAMSKAGVPTYIREDGDVKIESAGHGRKVDKFFGVHDRNGTSG